MKIIILDFNKRIGYVYTAPDKEMKAEDYENFITQKGHNINNCQWMVTPNKLIFKDEKTN